MGKNILYTEAIGLVNRSDFAVMQLEKSWAAIFENLNEWVFFVCWKSDGVPRFTFHNVDDFCVREINEFLKDPDTSLFMLKSL